MSAASSIALLLGACNKNDEYVVIKDSCGLNFENWEIKDESTRDYTFTALQKAERFILYSEKGVDNDGELYWGRGSVWNDDKDSIFIRDSQGLLVYYDSYGY